MAVKERSFWSTTAGVVTGVTGFVTAIVGLLTVAVQLGWLSSHDDGGKPAGSTATTTSGSASTVNPALGGANTTSASSSAPQLSVTPTEVRFGQLALGSRDSVVTVKNTGSSGFTLKTPTVSGLNANLFSISGNTCTGRLDAGRSCEIKVTFTSKGTGDFTAALVIQPDAAGARATEVPLSATGIL